MQSDYIIEMLNIRKEFPGIVANDDITLQLEGGCTSPVAAFAQVEGAMLTLTGLYVSPDETIVRRGFLRGEKTNAEKLGAELARRLKGE